MNTEGENAPNVTIDPADAGAQQDSGEPPEAQDDPIHVTDQNGDHLATVGPSGEEDIVHLNIGGSLFRLTREVVAKLRDALDLHS